MAAYTRQQIVNEFPWLRDTPGLVTSIQTWMEDGMEGEQILYRLRQSRVYRQQLFPGMFDDDNRMRFDSEASYIQTMNDYGRIMRNYNPDGASRYEDFRDFQGLLQMNVSPAELEDRYKIWHQVQNSSQPVKDAYYIYAGLELADEQIYAAIVDPSAYRQLKRQYDARVANLTSTQQVFDRMQERTAANLGSLVSDMEETGVITQAEADQMLRHITPNRVGRWINAMLNEAQARAGGDREYMGLADLQQAMNYALIGSAATQAGFELPEENRIAALVDAGVDRAKALETYGLMARQGGFMAGAMQRAHLGRGTTEEMEEGLFGVSGAAAARVDWAMRTEEARAAERGGPGFGQTRQGQIVQSGLRAQNR